MDSIPDTRKRRGITEIHHAKFFCCHIIMDGNGKYIDSEDCPFVADGVGSEDSVCSFFTDQLDPDRGLIRVVARMICSFHEFSCIADAKLFASPSESPVLPSSILKILIAALPRVPTYFSWLPAILAPARRPHLFAFVPSGI